jgi:hypothetical protein
MLGYDYETIYKKGKWNAMVDALSKQFEENGSLLALSLPILGWLKESHREWLANSFVRYVILQL